MSNPVRHMAGGSEPPAPVLDVINTVALAACADQTHCIHFLQGDIVQSMSLAELDRRAGCVARHLHRLGVRRGDRVGVMASNRVEWVLVDLALLKLGGIVAGFEPGRYDAAIVVDQFGLKRLFVENSVVEGRLINIADVWEWGDEPISLPLSEPFHDGYRPTDICAIKFTSGSTGQPKGLEATVGSINDTMAAVDAMFHHGDSDNILVFLRLALLQQRYWIYSALVHGHDLTLSTLDQALHTARATSPSVIMGVPGFYEDVKARLEAAESGLCHLPTRRQAIQSLLGGRIRYLWTGSAPASLSVLEFFDHCGVPLYEGYGLNETCIVAKNYPGACRIGSVGKVLPHKTVRVDAEGVLIVGSRSPVNRRYTWCAPRDNERMFLPTGEVKTNDLGHIDKDGFLYIHGRVDDIISLSSGRNVLVRLIEEKLRQHPDVHDCVLYGNGKPFLTAIISPAREAVNRDALEKYVRAMNQSLLPEQRVCRLLLAPERFSIDNGLLTSQFKPRRSEIHRRYAAEFEAIYGTLETAELLIFPGLQPNTEACNWCALSETNMKKEIQVCRGPT